MQFTCSILCELPFMLNLPNGSYTVAVDGAAVHLEVLQEQLALHLSQRDFAVADAASLQAQFGARYTQSYKQPMRTILRETQRQVVDERSLPTVSDADLIEDMTANIIKESPMAFAEDTSGLNIEARRRLDAMSPEERAAFAVRSSKLRYSRRIPDTQRFLAAANALIRLYMQRFKDFFVEEVAVHQLASQSPLSGVYVEIECDGESIHNYGVVERFPPIMRKPWWNHPDDQVAKFRDDLSKGVPPDSVELLGIRARSFVQRGAYRSAIIEASAALDLAVSRKIRDGYRMQGKGDAEIDALLRTPANQRFDVRAKRILRESTGRSAAEFDNSLWARVSAHRTTHRQGVSHADSDPPKAEAEQVVEDFLALAGYVAEIIPHVEIELRAYSK